MDKEYIEREAALNNLAKSYFAGVLDDLLHAEDAVNAVPAADVVEVVRCRECIYAPSGPEYGGFDLEWPHDDWPEDNPCPCKCEDGWYSRKPKPDYYCASGKRKDGGSDDGHA